MTARLWAEVAEAAGAASGFLIPKRNDCQIYRTTVKESLNGFF